MAILESEIRVEDNAPDLANGYEKEISVNSALFILKYLWRQMLAGFEEDCCIETEVVSEENDLERVQGD